MAGGARGWVQLNGGPGAKLLSPIALFYSVIVACNAADIT